MKNLSKKILGIVIAILILLSTNLSIAATESELSSQKAENEEKIENAKDQQEEINEAKNIAINIPIVSYQSKLRNKTITLIAKAIKSIFMIGSPNDSSNNFKNVFFFTFVISFVPNSILLFSTSLSLNPICLSSQNKYMKEK